MPRFDSRYYVAFTADNGLTVQALLDENSPVLTAGVGGWEVVDRPRRVSMTRYKGRVPFRQDIAVIFDGSNQEPHISRLTRMAVQDEKAEPPKIKVSGTALRKDLTWVIDDLTWDNTKTIWEVEGGTPVRIRQHVVVHLLQFVDDNVLQTAPSPAVVAKGSTQKKITVPQGMTLKQVAAIELGDPNRYLDILYANPWLNPDPRALIPPGTVLTIPGKPGSFTIPGSRIK